VSFIFNYNNVTFFIQQTLNSRMFYFDVSSEILNYDVSRCIVPVSSRFREKIQNYLTYTRTTTTNRTFWQPNFHSRMGGIVQCFAT